MVKAGLTADLEQLLTSPVETDVPLSKMTTWKIGGPADFVVAPCSDSELTDLLNYLSSKCIPWIIIGNGSNLLVGDLGFRGVVIKLGENFSEAVWHGLEVEAKAGMLLGSLALEAADRGAAGLEFARGIPGSLGGAVRMNAGAYGKNICQYIKRVEAIDYQGNKRVVPKEEISYTYRDSSLAHLDAVITMVVLKLEPGNKDKIMAMIKDYQRRRGISQPLEYPSCGSVFRNPPDDYVGRLVELIGLKGFQVGGAQIANKHGNFIINLGNATASDVRALMEHVQQTIFDYSGIKLESEVKMIGEFK